MFVRFDECIVCILKPHLWIYKIVSLNCNCFNSNYVYTVIRFLVK